MTYVMNVEENVFHQPRTHTNRYKQIGNMKTIDSIFSFPNEATTITDTLRILRGCVDNIMNRRRIEVGVMNLYIQIHELLI